jgi:hypothetical protein
MEENVVLQVVLHEGNGLEIRIGNDDKINPLMLIGVLEQVKSNILNGNQVVEESQIEKPKYDA